MAKPKKTKKKEVKKPKSMLDVIADKASEIGGRVERAVKEEMSKTPGNIAKKGRNKNKKLEDIAKSFRGR